MTGVAPARADGRDLIWRMCRDLWLEDGVRAIAVPCPGATEPILRHRIERAAARLAVLVRPVNPAGPGGRAQRTPVLIVEQTPLGRGDVRADALRRRVMERPIDPARGPLVRFVLMEMAGGHAELIVSAHLAALDDAALASLAEAVLDGDPALERLRPVARGPAAQRELASPSGPFSIPLDWARPADQPMPVGIAETAVAMTIDEPTLRAAAALVLSRYSGRSAVPIAVTGPHGHRLGARLPAVAHVPVDDQSTWSDLCNTTAAAPALPVPTPPEGLSLPDWLPTVSVVEDAGPDRHSYVGSQPTALELRRGAAQVTCRYRTDLVQPAAAEAFLSAVATVHSAPPHRLVGAVEIVRRPQDETASLDQVPHVDPAGSIHGLVAAQARQRPSAIAVSCQGEQLSYAQLDQRSTAMAQRLAAAGVQPGARVGVSLERSVALIVALLGVLKAGAAYVPVDPSYPAARQRFIADDAGLAAIVTAEDPRSSVVAIPMLRPPAGDDGEPNGSASNSADANAYVIYTSGSTGVPKGVLVTHHNVLSLLAATEAYQFGPDDVWTAFHSYAFDFSVWEIWGCLTTGGRLEVVPIEVARDPEAFRDLLAAQRVTVLNQTPSAFSQLLNAERTRRDRLAVRLLIFGGEQLDTRMLLPWFDQYGDDSCHVVNMYGITETTVHCTWKRLRREDALAGTRSVGVPIPGWSLQVLDAAGRLLPVGVPGELSVGGLGLAQGYLNQPALTAQRFVPDPTGPPGACRYRSGDRGRLLASGEFEHLGRLDSQVKIRGHRIELGEVRAALLAAPAVLAAAVVVRERDGDANLEAFVVGPGAEPRQLRERLSAELPAYQLPTSITVIDEMPVTVNGKLDVERLPDPAPVVDQPAAANSTAGGAPDVETWLTRLWQGMLGVPIDPDDNLFVLGGTSLMAVKTATAVRHAGLGELRVMDIYRLPTVRQVAAALAGSESGP